MLFRILPISILLALTACSDAHVEEEISPPLPETSAPEISAAEKSTTKTSQGAPFRLNDVEETDFTCPHQESREVFFTSPDTADELDIQIIGDDCDTAKIRMRIITPLGEVVHETEARALDYTYEDVGAAGVERMLQSFLSSQYFETALDDLSQLTEHNGFYELNRDAAMKAGEANQPLFCHRAGKSYANCYAFLDGRSVFIFNSGS